MTFAGGCRCGEGRYTLALDALPPIYCCHCGDCQRWSGSAFSEQLIAPRAALAATGPIVTYAYTNRGGTTSTQHVCGICHNRLWNENDRLPGMLVVRAGTLDDSPATAPVLHMWTSRKQPWIVLPDGVAAYPENAPPADLFAILKPSSAKS